MSCCSNAMWKHLCTSGTLTKERAFAATPRLEPRSEVSEVRLFVNGTFLLAEATTPGDDVTAVLVSGETITAVGDAATLQAAYPQAEVVDLGGTTLAPGFVEPHVHIIAAIENTYSQSLAKAVCPTFASVIARITTVVERAYQAATSTGKPYVAPWCFFVLFDPSLLEFDPKLGFPQLSFAELDRIPHASDVNIFVENASAHIAYANQLAFTTAQISTDKTTWPVGATYCEDADGNFTGVMLEPPSFGPFLHFTPTQEIAEQALPAMLAFLSTCQQAGITTVADPAVGVGGSLEVELAVYDFLASYGLAATDVVGSIDLTSLYSLPPATTKVTYPGLNLPASPGATGSFGNLIIPAVKIWADGSTQGYTGYLSEPYLPPVTPPQLGDLGEADWTPADMSNLLKQARDDNWSALVHCNGDAGLGYALGSLREAYGLDSGFRLRIEHCTVTEESQYDEMKALGVTPTYLTNHIHIWGDTFLDNILGPARANRLDAVKDALDRDLIFSFHCDYATSNPGPLQYMQTAVTRTTGAGVVLGAQLCIGALDALKGVTIYPAMQLGIDHLVGTITAGKRANFVQLAQDPTTCPSTEIASTTVLATYLRGRRIAVG